MRAQKRAKGQFFTQKNPFTLKPFQKWADTINIKTYEILEPFAGSNNLISMLQKEDLCSHYKAYDIEPASPNVIEKDTLKNFPAGFEVCITNPPWLARNSAVRRCLPYPKCQYDDLYKHCLKLCLDNCAYVGALIPASFLQSGLFRDRLETYILLQNVMFNDTENPVCLALFGKQTKNGEPKKDINIYYDDKEIGLLGELETYLPKPLLKQDLTFNDPKGRLGFISFDNTKEASIRFCKPEEIENYTIKESSRFITKIGGEFGNIHKLIEQLNHSINQFRKQTKDVFLTPFKGMRQDDCYRRRMSFALAKRFIYKASNEFCG